MQCLHYERNYDELMFLKAAGHEQFHSSLGASKLLTQQPIQECTDCSEQPKLGINPVYEEAMQTAEGKPWDSQEIHCVFQFIITWNRKKPYPNL